MSSGKGAKTLPDKLKSWFKGSRHQTSASSAAAPSSTSLPSQKQPETLTLSSQMLLDLSTEADVDTRMAVVKELSAEVGERRMDECGVELVWMKTKDLLDSGASGGAARLAVLTLYANLIQGQFDQLDVMRAYFFKVIECRTKDSREEDLVPLLEMLHALTQQGKDILHFEERIGPYLYNSFPKWLKHEGFYKFLQILLNVIKFNPAYLDPDVVCGLIGYLGHTCMVSRTKQNIDICLQCFYAIMGYSYIPKEALPVFVSTLCRVVNIEDHCTEAWRIMSSLMATHLGHSALYNLCQTTANGAAEKSPDVALVRGAVFFIGMSLWGSKCVKTMQNYSPMTILPTFVEALQCKHHLVTYEVTLQLERLVMKRGSELRAPGCDSALDLIKALLKALPRHQDERVQGDIDAHIHNAISKFEDLSVNNLYKGSQRKLFDLIDACASQRPENSVIRLIAYRTKSLYPTNPVWVPGLHDLMDKYYRHETRDNIRIKCLLVLLEKFKSNRHIYEEDLLEKVVLPFLKSLDDEPVGPVRHEAIRALTSICEDCCSRESIGLLEILERIVSKPLEKVHKTDVDPTGVKITILGLIQAFRTRLCQQPASFIVRVYNILANHLEDNYRHPECFPDFGNVRLEIFRLLLALRSSETFHLGLLENDGTVRFSPNVVCREPRLSSDDSPTSTIPSAVTYLSLTKACMCVVKSLSEERDWEVLKLILAQVPTVLQNKAIITRYGKALHMFVVPLIKLTNKESGYPDILVNTPHKGFGRVDFHNHVFPVLAAMASYNEHLESKYQKSLINALQVGLLSRDCSRTCIVALTACALEMKKSMDQLLRLVLLNFSKISATKLIATPMLEFLSTLIRLPDIFSSFIDTDYMSVFAIALPFTNPFKFDAYTVSLAHHVIIMWFLKCRLTYRQSFVQFIITGLNSNVIQSFEEGGVGYRRSVTGSTSSTSSTSGSGGGTSLMAQAASKFFHPSDGASNANDPRKRSSSLSENHQNKTARERHMTGSATAAAAAVAAAAKVKATANLKERTDMTREQSAKMASFHQELTETCVDILARYMFANPSVHPRRLPTTKFLLREGLSATWLVGTMLITITTSICDQTANRSGLCDRCHLVCSKSEKGTKTPNKEERENLTETRKRHQSEFQVQRPSPSRYNPGASAQDEYDLRRQLSVEKLAKDPNRQQEQQGNPEGDPRLECVLHDTNEGAEVKKPDLCACWCTGWAEVLVRRPAGDVSWMCRIQNSSLVSASHTEFPLADLTTLLMPSSRDRHVRLPDKDALDMSKRICVDTLSDKEYDALTTDKGQQSFSILPRLSSLKPEVDLDAAIKSPLEPKSPDSQSMKKTSSSSEVKKVPAQVEKAEARDDGGGSSRQSWGPIMEQEEDDLQVQRELLRRRTSLQPAAGAAGAHTEIGAPTLNRQFSSPKTGSPRRSREASGTPPTPGVAGIPFGRINPSGDPAFRDRAHTVSGPSPRRASAIDIVRKKVVGRGSGSDVRRSLHSSGSAASASSADATDMSSSSSSTWERVTGISPQFVFLQLYNSSTLGNVENLERPILLPASVENSIKNLDRIHAHETHKMGVVYVGPGQIDNEVAILRNEFGSLRYAQFLKGLGSLICLKDIDKASTYLGGLDHCDGDGDFAYMWEDDVMQVIFHTATLMPNHERDPQANKKKRHIGNDFVTIVYNNSEGGRYKMGTIKGQFIYACVVVTPLEEGSNRVFIECRPELDEPLGHVKEPKIVSDRNLAILVRQLALHCNLAAQIQQTLGSGRDPYSSNWLERLRQIKRIREKVLHEERRTQEKGSGSSGTGSGSGLPGRPTALNDFTRFVLRRGNGGKDD